MNFFERSFAAGEIAPSLYGRVDLVKYATGLRTCRNFFIGRSGGAYNRPGLGFRTAVQDSTNTVRLKSFTTQQGYKYLLEFGNYYLRITDQGIPVMTAPIAVSGYIATGTTQTTLIMGAAHGWVVGDQITFTLVGSGGSVTNQAATITAVSPYQITFNFNSSTFGTFTSGTASLVTQRVVNFTTPWPSSVLQKLTFAQDGNVLSVVQQSVYPQTLTYLGRQSWTFGNVSMAPKTQAVTNLVASPNTASNAQIAFWGVTAIDADTFEESYVTTVSSSQAPSTSTPVALTWNAVPGAVEYNIYFGGNSSTLGFRSIAYTNGWADNGQLNVDFTNPPPIPRSFFSSAGAPASSSFLPAAIGIFQQRRWYGNVGPVPEFPAGVLPTVAPAADRMIGSRIGSPTFFATKRPITDDGSISFRLVHRDPQLIRHFLDLGKLVVFTEQGEWVIQGGDNGITPSAVNPTCVSQNGSGDLRPLAIGNTAIYRQNKGSIIRTFGFEFQVEGYRGDDLTVFSRHLVDNNVILAWDYCKIPNPIIWMVRDDGTVLSLTFVPEQAIFAWARHDTVNGFVEDVCQCDDRVYFVVRRVINGQTVRYIERLHNRNTTPINTAIYLDSSVTYNGTQNPATQSITLSGGSTWNNGELITITGNGITFNSASLPGAIHLTGSDGTFVRMTGLSYVNATTLTGTPSRMIPATMQNIQISNVVLAQVTITGLSNLEGQKVSVIGDGFVVASVNNTQYPTLTVTGGQVTLPQAYGVVHVGLPITADLETLNIDTSQGQSILDKGKVVTKISMWVEQTRGLFVAASPPDGVTISALQGMDPTITSFYEPKVRYSEGYSQPNQLLTRVIEQALSGQWTTHGRVLVRQVDPLPAAVLAIAPAGLAPIGM